MHHFNVLDHGALADASTNSAPAINRAIFEANQKGGGTVFIPAGTYLCGTIRLLSRVTLHLEPGARILGSPRLEDYETRVWGHHCDITPWHLILAEDCEDISITGTGTIDGNGHHFWENERPSEWHYWKAKVKRVSPMIELVRCQRVIVENIRMTGSAGWTLHLHDCDDSVITGLQIKNTLFGPNTDGIDLTGCHRVIISNCQIHTGDDAIALKTSDYSRSCEYITISNCVLQTSCVALRVGYESRQDFRHITVTNLVIPSCSRMIDLRSVEGCGIEHVLISNITGTTNSGWPANRPIGIALHSCANVYKHQLIPEHPDYEKEKPVLRKGYIRDVTIRDLNAVTDGRIMITSDEDLDLSDIRLENIRLRYAMIDDPSPFQGASAVGFIPGEHGDARSAHAAFVLKNAKRVSLRSIDIQWPSGPPPADWHLLHSSYRHWNKALYVDQVERVQTEGTGVKLERLWQKNCPDLREID